MSAHFCGSSFWARGVSQSLLESHRSEGSNVNMANAMAVPAAVLGSGSYKLDVLDACWWSWGGLMVFREDLRTNLLHYKGRSRTKQIQRGRQVFYQEAARNPRIPAYRNDIWKMVGSVVAPEVVTGGHRNAPRQFPEMGA